MKATMASPALKTWPDQTGSPLFAFMRSGESSADSMSANMSHKSTIIALVCFAALVSGCSSGSTSTSPPDTRSPAPPATHSAIREMRPVANVTAACTLLSAAELKELLAGAAETDVTATEDKPERPSGSRLYTCEYGTAGNNPYALSVTTMTSAGGAFTPKAAIGAVADSAGAKTHILHSVGQAAVFYTQKDDVSVLAAAKRSHGQVRVTTFAASRTVPGRKFIAVVKLVLSRI